MSRQVTLGLAAVALMWLIILGWWFIPTWQINSFNESLTPGERLPPKDIAELTDNYRKTLTQIIGGLGVAIGLVFTYRTLIATQRSVETAREGQITERFTRAIDQLGDDKLEIRIGGIYALERIARDSNRDYWPIIEVLTTYVRMRAPWPPGSSEEDSLYQRDLPAPPRQGQAWMLLNYVRENIFWMPNKHRVEERNAQLSPSEKQQQPLAQDLIPGRGDNLHIPDPDIRAALAVIRRLTHDFGKQGEDPIDLSGTDLRGGDLRGAYLEGIRLFNTRLEKANLFNVNLERARLGDADDLGKGAHLEEAQLKFANLKKARLHGAFLNGSQLERAELQEAELYHASLMGAKLRRAQLQGARFHEAHLEDAQFVEANLQEAKLGRTYLKGTNFARAILLRADLRFADLRQTENLTQDQIDEADGDENTTQLPEDLHLPRHWAKNTNGPVDSK
jgi:uncharacterized protein YjbI with pentapeptide repeats